MAAGAPQQWQYEDNNAGGHADDSQGKYNRSPDSKNNTMFGGANPNNFSRGGPTNFLEDTGETRVRQPPVTLPSGAVYSGEWRNGMRDGEGT